MPTDRADDIIAYWFGDPPRPPAKSCQLWFSASPQTDAEVAARFGSDMKRAAAGRYDSWAATPQGRLALIVMLDQFPRHIHRGSPAAFDLDHEALGVCFDGLASGDDRHLTMLERVVFYLPLEHAEDLSLQARSVTLYRELLEAARPEHQQAYGMIFDYAVRHRDIIARFGRFPHRNAILGRASTLEELEFLQQPGSSF